MLRRSLLRSTQALRLQPSAASCLRKSSSQVKLASQEFNESRERSLLRHVISSSTEGDPNSVTAAMDTFWDTYFNGEGTAEWNLRGEALDEAVKAKGPKTAMEIGTYCGYTAVRMGKFIPDGGKLISVEIDPLYAAIATKMVEHAGLRDKVFVEIGSVKSRMASIKSKHGLSSPIDAVLLDHDVNDYLADLRLMEGEGLISKGTVVLCDWSLYPGSDGSDAPTESEAFMSYLSTSGAGATARHSLRDKEVFTVSKWEGPFI